MDFSWEDFVNFFEGHNLFFGSLAAFLAILAPVVWFFRATIFRRFRKLDGLAALAENLVEKYAASQAENVSLSKDNSELREQLQDALRLLETSGSEAHAGHTLADARKEIEAGRTGIAEAMLRDIAEAREAEGRTRIKEAAEAWRGLGSLAFLHNTDAAISAYKKATELDPLNAGGWNMLGLLRNRIGELNGAESAYGEALNLAEKFGDQADQAAALGNLGIVYKTRGDLDRAEEMYGKSLVIEEELGRKEGMASDYGNLGIVYQTRGDLDRAEEMYGKALAIHKDLGSKEGMARDYSNLGVVYQTRGDLDRAEEMYGKALAIHKKLGRKEGMASDYGNLGIVYQTRGDLDRAEEMYGKALAIRKDLGSKEGMANDYGNLGSVHQSRGDNDGARYNYQQALALFKQVGAAEKIAQLGGWITDLDADEED